MYSREDSLLGIQALKYVFQPLSGGRKTFSHRTIAKELHDMLLVLRKPRLVFLTGIRHFGRHDAVVSNV